MKDSYIYIALLSWGLFFSSMREDNCGMIRSLCGSIFLSVIWPVTWCAVLSGDFEKADIAPTQKEKKQ